MTESPPVKIHPCGFDSKDSRMGVFDTRIDTFHGKLRACLFQNFPTGLDHIDLWIPDKLFGSQQYVSSLKNQQIGVSMNSSNFEFVGL